MFIALIGANTGLTGAEARDKVTIDAVLARYPESISQMAWSDDELVAAFTDRRTGQLHHRRASLAQSIVDWKKVDCSKETVPGKRRHCWDVKRDDGGLLALQRRDDNLKLVVAGSEQRYRGRAYAGRSWFSPHSAWSTDQNYLVVVDRFMRLDSLARQPAIVNGIPIVDVGEEPRGLFFSEVFVIDVAKLRTVSVQTLEGRVIGAGWSKSNRLAITHMDSELNLTELLVAEPTSFQLKRLYVSKGRFQLAPPVFSPDERLIAWAIDADNRNWDDFRSLIVIDTSTGKERRLTFEQPIFGADYIWSPDGAQIYAPVRAGGLETIWAFPLQGSPRQLVGGKRRNHSISLSADGYFLAFRTEDGYGRKDARVLDLRRLQERIIHVEDDPTMEFSMGRWEHFRWKSTDDVQPFGFAFYPPDFDPTKVYPMIVDVHGGGPGSRLSLSAPLTIANAHGPLEWHAWAALGYVVFAPDYRSTGEYGPGIIAKRLREGEFDGLDDADDIVTGVEHMISRSFIDPQRIALLGHSAGGRRVFMALRKRGDLFAAAVFNDSIQPDPRTLSWQSLSGHSAGPGGGVSQLNTVYGASIAEQPDRYRTDYLFDAHKFRTPVLILMGDGERGFPHEPFEQLYSILHSVGVPSRMLIFPKEPHGYVDRRASKTAFEEVRRWFETHLHP